MTEGGGRVVVFRASGGVQLEAEVWGSDDSPPVLLAHGGGQTRLAWRETAGRLAASGFFAVAVDLRGHGASDRSADYSLTAFRDDIVALAERLGRPALVGASLGGQSSLLAEGETDGGVARALVLVDVAPTLEPDGVRRIMAFMERHLDGFASLDEAVEAVIAYQPHRPARARRRGPAAIAAGEEPTGASTGTGTPPSCRQARDHLDLVWERATAAARRRDRPDPAGAGRPQRRPRPGRGGGAVPAHPPRRGHATSPTPTTWWPATRTTPSPRPSWNSSRSWSQPDPPARLGGVSNRNRLRKAIGNRRLSQRVAIGDPRCGVSSE